MYAKHVVFIDWGTPRECGCVCALVRVCARVCVRRYILIKLSNKQAAQAYQQRVVWARAVYHLSGGSGFDPSNCKLNEASERCLIRS